MTVEEKAKAYDEALEKTRIYRDNARIAEDYGAVARYENIFPELRESKDERMMRVIGLALTDVPEERFTSLGTTLKDCLAYIEKQKDHFRDDTKMIEQKPEDDKAFEEWIDDWWKHNKVNNPNSYDKGDEIQFDEQGFKNFCRGIRNMYQHKPAEWLAIQGYTTEETVDRTPLNGPAGICLNLHDSTGFKIGDKVIVQIRKID